MEIFVINLDSSRDRLQNIKEELKKVQLSFQRISAVKGSALTPSERNTHYSSILNKKIYRRPLSNGEIGCYLSHRSCWQQIVDKKLPMALVLEDDAELDKCLPHVLSTIEEISLHWDIIKLCDPPRFKRRTSAIKLDKTINLCQYKKIPSRATGYAISYMGASKLLSTRNLFGRPVDEDMQFYWEFDGEVFGIEPSPISNSPLSENSNIDGNSSRKNAQNITSKFKGPLLRLKYELKLMHHNRRRKRLSTESFKH